MVDTTGIRTLANVDFQTNRNNLFVVAISIGIGMITLFESGIVSASLSAVLLSQHLNGSSGESCEPVAAARQVDTH